MKMTGHLTRSVFDLYDITSPKDHKLAAKLLDTHLAAAKSGAKRLTVFLRNFGGAARI